VTDTLTENLRKLTVDGVVYGWRVTHRPRPAAPHKACVDQLMAFRQGTSRAPLRILFPAGPAGGPEYIQRHGVVEIRASSITLNLHRPKTVAALIQRALDLGWSTKPMLVEDGFSFVSALPAAVREQLAESLSKG
jgi:hypothetical protein